jgi:Leucine-rich repeat (LRR) protein
MPAEPVSRPWRRFLRFSVRGMIVVVLLIGGWLGWIVRSAQIQREAVAAIKNAGGNVSYNWEWSNGKSISAGRPCGPKWLVNLIGVDYFGHVTAVGLFHPINDTVLVHVGRLTGLQQLHLSGTSISAGGLAHLKGLTDLWSLTIQSTPVTDAGLAHLIELTNLSVLYLDDTQVTDAELVHLKALTKLSYLSLWGNHVTDAGLAYLKGLTNLRELYLVDTQVSDAGVRDLQQALPSLKITR